jgi:hypothetical protein
MYSLLFFLLALAFAVLPAAYAYKQGDLDGVSRAEGRYSRQLYKVNRFRVKEAQQHAHYTEIYKTLRSLGLETIAETKAMFEKYRRVVQRRSGFPFDPVMPELFIPAELESPEPPRPRSLPDSKYPGVHA